MKKDKKQKFQCPYCLLTARICTGKIEDHCNWCGEYLETKFALDPEYCSKSCYSADKKTF